MPLRFGIDGAGFDLFDFSLQHVSGAQFREFPSSMKIPASFQLVVFLTKLDREPKVNVCVFEVCWATSYWCC
jgi:hypothetical protein